MINRKSIKEQITEAVIKEIPKQYSIYHQLTLDEVLFKWWMTGRQAGLRLTDEGVIGFQLADIAFYDYDFKQENQSWHSFLIEVNKKIKCPYYLGVKKVDKKGQPYIRFYDSKIAMMLSLYGTLEDYLASIKP